MKRIKRFLSFLLAVVLVSTSIQLPVSAAVNSANMDAKPADGTTQSQPYISGQTAESTNFRIPAMVTLDSGRIVTAADARWNTSQDGGGLDTIVSYSDDNGANWSYSVVNYLGDNGNTHNTGSTAFIDPVLTTDGTNLYLAVDLWPAGYALNGAVGRPPANAENGFDENGCLRLSGDNRTSYGYHLEKNADGSYLIKSNGDDGTVVSGYTVDAYFNIRGTSGNGTQVDTNLFCTDSPYQVYPVDYLYLTKSADGGATWGAPMLVNAKKTGEQAYLVGPGRGLVTANGTIIIPCYSFNGGAERTSFIYSADSGETWTRTPDATNITSSEAQLVELENGTLRCFFRNTTSHLCYVDAVGNAQDGYTWGAYVQTDVLTSSYTQLSAITYSKKIDGREAVLVSCPTGPNENGANNSTITSRRNGKIFVGLIQDDGSMVWKYRMNVTSNENTFLYSCMTELEDGSVSILYEPGMTSVQYQNYQMAEIAPQADVGIWVSDLSGQAIDRVKLDENTTSAEVKLDGIAEDDTVQVTVDGQYADNVTATFDPETKIITLTKGAATGQQIPVTVTISTGKAVLYVVSYEINETKNITLTAGDVIGIYDQSGAIEDTNLGNLDPSIAEVRVGEKTIAEQQARLYASGDYTGDTIDLSECLYSFNRNVDGTYMVSARTSDGTRVYLNPRKEGQVGFPNGIGKENIIVEGVGDGTFKLKDASDTKANGDNYCLTFKNDGHVFNEMQEADVTTGFHLYELQKPAANAAYQYTQVTEVHDGGQYVIMAEGGSDGNAWKYVLRPSAIETEEEGGQTGRNTHVAKLESGTVNKTEKEIDIRGIQAGGPTTIVVGTTQYNITVEEPGTPEDQYIELNIYDSVTVPGALETGSSDAAVASTETEYYDVVSPVDLENGGEYLLIPHANRNKAVSKTPKVGMSSANGLEIVDQTSDNRSTLLWTITRNIDGTYYIRDMEGNGNYMNFTNSSGDHCDVVLSENAQEISLEKMPRTQIGSSGPANGYQIGRGGYFLNPFGGLTWNCANGYNNNGEAGNQWFLSQESTTVRGISAGTATAVIGGVTYHITVTNEEQEITLKEGESLTVKGTFESEPGEYITTNPIYTESVMSVSELNAGGSRYQYLVIPDASGGSGLRLGKEQNMDKARKGLKLVDAEGADLSQLCWKFEKTPDGTYYMIDTITDGYLTFGANGAVSVESDPYPVTVEDFSGVLRIGGSGAYQGQYLNPYAGTANKNASYYNVANDNGNKWHLLRADTTITGVKAGETTAVIGGVTYHITVTSDEPSEERTVTIPAGVPYFVNGKLTGSVSDPSKASAEGTSVTNYHAIQSLDELTDEGSYLLVPANNNSRNVAVNKTELSAAGINGLGCQVMADENLGGLYWKITKNEDGTFYIRDNTENGKYLKFQNASGNHSDVVLSEAPQALTIDATTFNNNPAFLIHCEIANNSGTQVNSYLNPHGGLTVNNRIAGYVADDASSDNGSKWYLYQLGTVVTGIDVTEEDAPVTATIGGIKYNFIIEEGTSTIEMRLGETREFAGTLKTDPAPDRDALEIRENDGSVSVTVKAFPENDDRSTVMKIGGVTYTIMVQPREVTKKAVCYLTAGESKTVTMDGGDYTHEIGVVADTNVLEDVTGMFTDGNTELTFTGRAQGRTTVDIGDTRYYVYVTEPSEAAGSDEEIVIHTGQTKQLLSEGNGISPQEKGAGFDAYLKDYFFAGCENDLLAVRGDVIDSVNSVSAYYVGTATDLHNCWYMFQSTGDADTYYMTGRTETGQTVYIHHELAGNGKVNTVAAGQVKLEEAGDGYFYLNDNTDGNGNRYLVFSPNYTDKINKLDAANGTSTAAAFKFSLYRPAESGEQGSTEIPGYVRVENKADIQSGKSYLIVAGYTLAGENYYYAIYPNTATGNYDQTVRIAEHQTGHTFSSVTLTGKEKGETTLKIGAKTYHIVVKDESENLTAATTPVITKSGGGRGNGKPLSKLTISADITNYTLGIGNGYDGKDVIWSIEDQDIATIDANGVITVVLVDTETELHTNIIATIDGAEYKIPLIVSQKPTGTSKKMVDLYLNSLEHTIVSYAWIRTDVGSNDNAVHTSLSEAVEGEMIYVNVPRDLGVAIDFFAKAEEGYALTRMGSVNTAGHYATLDSENPLQSEFVTATAYAGKVQLERFGKTVMNSLLTIAVGSDHQFEGAQGFTRTYTDETNISSSLDYRSEKLPTVTKEVLGVLGKDGEFRGYTEGMMAQQGEYVYYRIAVQKYASEDTVIYSDVKLTDLIKDGLSDAKFVEWDPEAGTPDLSEKSNEKDITTDITNDGLNKMEHVYTVAYQIKNQDIANELKNTVELSFNYQTHYDGKSYAGTANADAVITAANFVMKDIVADFGLPVKIVYGNTEHGITEFITGEFTTKYGSVTVERKELEEDMGSEYTITYTPNGILKGVDTVTLTNTNNAKYIFHVYPATSVYYEEGFADYTDSWTGEKSKGNKTQECQVLANPVESQYGFDPKYSEESAGPSNGTEAVSAKAGDSATFEFAGTGVDIYANCQGENNSNGPTGTISVLVKDTSDGAIKKLMIVNTKVAGTAGSATENQNAIASAYHLPVASVDLKDHGNYRVSIAHTITQTERENNTTYPVKLDGFRVYNTLLESESDVYKAHGEKNPNFMEMRNVVLNALSLSGVLEGEDRSIYAEDISKKLTQVLDQSETGEGIILSGTAAGYTNENLKELLDNGPKNEIFLYEGQSLVFGLKAGLKNVQIGMKAVDALVNVSVSKGAESVGGISSIQSSTDMFYRIGDIDGDTAITITNNGDGVLSVTDLKYFIADQSGVSESAIRPLGEEDLVSVLMLMGYESREAENPDPGTGEEEKPDPGTDEKEKLPFTDVADDEWYYDAISYVYHRNLMTGLTKDTFGAADSIVRAQFAVILHRIEGEPPIKAALDFVDVDSNTWYTGAVRWANASQIATGYSNTKLFGTNDPITREQMAVMMYRYANYKEYDVSGTADFSKFEDAAQVSGFAQEAMKWAVGTGIISGKDNGTKLDPQGNANRAECATIIMRFDQKYGEAQ